MAWRVHMGVPLDPGGAWSGIDNCEESYRVEHVETQNVIPLLPFMRKEDADRAVAILQSKCPCDGISDARKVGKMVKEMFGSDWYDVKRYLATECCAW